MRRAAVIGLALGLTYIPASAVVQKPRCGADIVDAAGSYQGSVPTFLLDLTLTTASPACASATFSVYVLDDPPSATPEPIPILTQQSRMGDGITNSVRFTLSVSDDDDTICIWAASRTRTRPIDRAPDGGCVAMTAPTTFGSVASFD